MHADNLELSVIAVRSQCLARSFTYLGGLGTVAEHLDVAVITPSIDPKPRVDFLFKCGKSRSFQKAGLVRLSYAA